MPYDFDGVDDDIAFGSDASIDDIFAASPNTGTIAFWFRRDGTGFQCVVSKFNDAAPTLGWYVFFRGAGGGHTLAFQHGWTVLPGAWQTTSTFNATGAWRHAAIAYDGSSVANNPLMWIDGVPETVVEFSTPSVTIGSDAAIDLVLGDTADSAAPLNGAVSNLRLGKTIWTDGQVLRHLDWDLPGGQQLVWQPTLTGSLVNHGTGVADGTLTGAVMVGFHKVQRPGGMMMMGIGL